MAKTYTKKDTGAKVTAVKVSADKWRLVHADGNVTVLSDPKFKKRYVQHS